MKISTKTLLSFSLLILAISCTRQLEKGPESELVTLSQDGISEDTVFINLLLSQINHYSNIKNLSKISDALKDNQLSAAELMEYPTYFGYKNLSELTGYYSLMKKRVEYLNKFYNFSDIIKEKKRELIINKLKKIISNSNGDTKVFTTDLSGSCEQIRINCILSVSAEVLIMHLGCAALDLSIIGGILCHGAATLYQATAGNNCNLNYQQCINQQPS